MLMELYKFRTITDSSTDSALWKLERRDLDRIKYILHTGKFYMAEWKDLNDPMEGYFLHYAQDTSLYKSHLKRLMKYKYEQRICCLSKDSHNIFLWATYTNNFKGLAIEVTLNSNHPNLFRVKYKKELPIVSINENTGPKEILYHKTNPWRYEKEWRYIDESREVILGEITAVHFGLRMNDQHKQEIRNIIKDKIPCYETEFNFDMKIIEKIPL